MAPDESEKRRTVFVVHGRDDAANRALFSFLRALHLVPLEWEHVKNLTGKGSPYIGDILRAGFEAAQAVVVLLTPDDYAKLCPGFRKQSDKPFEGDLMGQPRQSVLFEAGMAMGLYEERTILVEMGALRPIGDIIGRYTIRLNDTPEARNELASSLCAAGCSANKDGRHWLNEGDFANALAGIWSRDMQGLDRRVRMGSRHSESQALWTAVLGQPNTSRDFPELRHLSMDERQLLMRLRRPSAKNRLSVKEVILNPTFVNPAHDLKDALVLIEDDDSVIDLILTESGKCLADSVWRNAILRVIIRNYPDGAPLSVAALCAEFGISKHDGKDYRDVVRHMKELQRSECITSDEQNIQATHNGMERFKNDGIVD
jgi:hypothetical protein